MTPIAPDTARSSRAWWPRARPGTGVAPGATIFPVRVAIDPEEGSEAALAAGIGAAIDAGVDVVNISIVTYLDAPELRRPTQGWRPGARGPAEHVGER